jgi:hypothetical protein
MSYPLTIPQIILGGQASTYLSFNEVGENVLYGSRVVKSPDPTLIALFTDILKWRYDKYPSDETLRGTANYAIWLYGKYQIQAQGNAMGGGSVIIGSGGYVYRVVNDTIVTQSPTYYNAAFIGGKDFGTLTLNNQELSLIRNDFSINTTTGIITNNTGDFFPDDSISTGFNQKINA